jgi:hypothetical protein
MSISCHNLTYLTGEREGIGTTVCSGKVEKKDLLIWATLEAPWLDIIKQSTIRKTIMNGIKPVLILTLWWLHSKISAGRLCFATLYQSML